MRSGRGAATASWTLTRNLAAGAPPADRRGLEPVELAVADRSAARELPPGRSTACRSQHGIARDALPEPDVLLQPAEADRHAATEVELGRRTARAGDTPVDGPAGCEVLGEQRRQARPQLGE